MSSFPTIPRDDSPGSHPTIGLWTICFGLLVLAASARFSQGQQPDNADAPATAEVTDDEDTATSAEEEPMVTPPEAPLPEVPETTVVGRPGAFPAGPLVEGTVTTPTRTATSIGQVGSATTVISSEQIRRSGYSVVGDLLEGTTGLRVVRQGAPGGLTSVFLRGANSNQTKVLLDGIPINDPSSAGRAFDFSHLSVDNIERIEIVRGPQSTLYGTDAIGGVINIITKRGEGPLTARAKFMGGSYGTNRQDVSVSGGTNCVNYSIGGSHYYTDGFSSASERLGNTEDDHHRLGTVSGRFGWTPTETFDVDYVFRWADLRTNIDNFDFTTGLPLDEVGTSRQSLTESFYSRIQARWEMFDGGIEQRLAYNLTDYSRGDTGDLGAVPFPVTPSAFEGQTRKLEWQADVLLLQNNLLSVGADYYVEDASSSFGLAASQNKYGFFLQDQIELAERWFTTVGFRWDTWNVAGEAQTYQVRSVYNVHETGTSFHGTLGTGFRAPSLSENLDPLFGNPALKPEESQGWDVGATQRLLGDDMIVEFYYYRNDLRNLIVFDFSIPPFGALANVGRARTHGVEVNALWNIHPDVALSASYTRTDTLNVDTGLPLARRPKDQGSIGATYRYCEGRGAASLYALFFGDSIDNGVFGGPAFRVLDGYTLLNMVADYQLTEHMRCFCRFDNLLNEHYEVVTGYGTPLSSAFGGIDLVW
ncbi:MAG: TonB-dependent receptor [Pirellulaceae bacterium]|nr:TonB-dependent receptor [Pirellulaceae bacterium]